MRMTKTIPVFSPTEKAKFTEILIEKLNGLKTLEHVRYVEISQWIGVPVEFVRGCLSKARRYLQQKHRKVFETIYSYGIQRKSNLGIVRSARKYESRICKTAEAAGEELSCADPWRLPSPVQTELAQFKTLFKFTVAVHRINSIKEPH